MPSVDNHILRDAQHAARSDIRVALMKFVRRLDGDAKANIDNAIAEAVPGAEIDGEAIGREAAQRAISRYLAPGEPQPAIEGTTN